MTETPGIENVKSTAAPTVNAATAPLETTDLKFLEPDRLQFFRIGALLRLTVKDDCSYLRVSVVRAFPLSEPARYYSVRDGEDKEIGIVVNPGELDADSRRLVSEELERRYMVPVIERVHAVKERFGTLDWTVDTDRGPRKFTTRNPRENSVLLSADRYLITDVDGNRYEIKDLPVVDAGGILMRHF